MQNHSAYMVRVCVRCVVQDNRLGKIPPEDAEIFDVVAKNAGAVVLIQAMSAREDINTVSFAPSTVIWWITFMIVYRINFLCGGDRSLWTLCLNVLIVDGLFISTPCLRD